MHLVLLLLAPKFLLQSLDHTVVDDGVCLGPYDTGIPGLFSIWRHHGGFHNRLLLRLLTGWRLGCVALLGSTLGFFHTFDHGT